jgi:hypothetical protein
MEPGKRESSGETIMVTKRGNFPPSHIELWLPAPLTPPIKHCWAISPELPALRVRGSLAKEKYIKNPQIINIFIALFHNFSVSPQTPLIYIYSTITTIFLYLTYLNQIITTL